MSDAVDLQSKQSHTPVVSSRESFIHFMCNHTPHRQHLIWSPPPLVRWRQLGMQDLGCEVSVDVPDTARGVAVFVVPSSVSTTAFVVVLSCWLEGATSGSEDIFTMLRLDSMSWWAITHFPGEQGLSRGRLGLRAPEGSQIYTLLMFRSPQESHIFTDNVLPKHLYQVLGTVRLNIVENWHIVGEVQDRVFLVWACALDVRC